MSDSLPASRARLHPEEIAPWVAGVVLALPVVFVRYPPMGDLAFHESIVAILRHFSDPQFFPPGLYTLRLGHPNQLFHFIAWGLSWVFPTDWACKLIVAATVLGIVTGAGRLASAFGGTRWSAVVVSPVALGWMFRWGLVPNMVGLAILLWALPALDRCAAEPTPRRALGCALLSVMLYLGHESAMVLFAVASVVFAVRTPRTVRHFALLAIPGATAVALAVSFAVYAESLKTPSIRAVADATLPLSQKIDGIPGALFSVTDASLPMFLVTALGAFALWFWGRTHASQALASRGGSRRVATRLLVVALLSFGLYLAMPLTLGGSTLIHQRFLAPAFVLAVVAVAPGPDAVPRWAPALLAFPLAMLALTMGMFLDQDRRMRALDRVLARMEDGSAVAPLDLTPRGPSVVAPVVGAAARALAVHGGRLLFSFTDAPYLPVGITRAAQWNEPVMRLAKAPFAFVPAHDLARFRYALVWLEEPRLAAPIVAAFAPEGRLVTTDPPWMLFESTLPRVPITAPDAPPPVACAVSDPLCSDTSLGQRIAASVER